MIISEPVSQCTKPSPMSKGLCDRLPNRGLECVRLYWIALGRFIMNADNVEIELLVEGEGMMVIEAMGEAGLTVRQTAPSRFIDLPMVIGLVASTINLINALINLAERLRRTPNAPATTVRNISGNSLSLNQASAASIREFIEATAREDQP